MAVQPEIRTQPAERRETQPAERRETQTSPAERAVLAAGTRLLIHG
jgi:hypothetical protein